MKVIWRIGVLLILVLAFLYYMDDRVLENELLESPVNHGNPIPVPPSGEESRMDALARPTKGISTFVGKKRMRWWRFLENRTERSHPAMASIGGCTGEQTG